LRFWLPAPSLAASPLWSTLTSCVKWTSERILKSDRSCRDLPAHGLFQEVLTLATVKNTGKEAVSEYLIAIPADRAAHLSYVQGVVGAKGEGAAPAEERPTKKATAPAGSKAPQGTVFYSVSLAQPLKPEEELQVQFITAFSRVLVSVRPSP